MICKKVISLDSIQALLSTGSTPLLSGFVSKKSGKEFSAKLVLENGSVVFRF